MSKPTVWDFERYYVTECNSYTWTVWISGLKYWLDPTSNEWVTNHSFPPDIGTLEEEHLRLINLRWREKVFKEVGEMMMEADDESN